MLIWVQFWRTSEGTFSHVEAHIINRSFSGGTNIDSNGRSEWMVITSILSLLAVLDGLFF